MPFVVDASVSLAWYLEDETSAYADRVLERLSEDDALVPAIWIIEIANGLLVAERRRRVSAAGVSSAVERLLDLPVSVREAPFESALSSILNLARAHRLTAYDAAYLDLAMREGAPLATQDEDLRAAAARVGVEVL